MLTRQRYLPALVATALLAACSTPSPSPSPTASGGGATPPPSFGPTATPGSSLAAGPVDVERMDVTLERFATVRGSPLAIAAPADGTGRLFVASQDGQIWVVGAEGKVGAAPMIDLAPRLVSGGEQGLLGLDVHPSFPADPRVFVNYTDLNGDTIVASLAIDPGNPDRILDKTHRRLLFVDQPYANHNGGEVAFGPDGFLYVFLGDGGAGGDPHGNGQRLDTLLGKVLRIDVDKPSGDEGYGIPSGNPFADRDGRDEIWAYGLRNPWRASFDRATGDLWIGDVGQGAWEEVDLAPAGGGGLNFGWNRMEGDHCFPPDSKCRDDGLTRPITEYGHGEGCTIIGGYVYRGATHPFMQGAYLFADYCSGTIWAIDAASSGPVNPVVVGSLDSGSISSFGEDVAGELYITTLGGDVYRVTAAER
jgi:glucose/arabinose dehydrogenase